MFSIKAYFDADGFVWYWREKDGHWKYSGEVDWRSAPLEYSIGRPSEHLLNITNNIIGLVNMITPGSTTSMIRMSDTFLDVVHFDESRMRPMLLPHTVSDQLNELEITHSDSVYGAMFSLLLSVADEDLHGDRYHEFDEIRMKTALTFGYLTQTAWFFDVIDVMNELDELLAHREFSDMRGDAVYGVNNRISEIHHRLLDQRSLTTRLLSSPSGHMIDAVLQNVLSFLF